MLSWYRFFADTAVLYINILYADDNNPVFNPNMFSIDVRSDTALGQRIVAVRKAVIDFVFKRFLKCVA